MSKEPPRSTLPGASGETPEEGGRATLTPPEWTRSARGRARAALAPGPLARRNGAAEEATLRAKIEDARASNDEEVERVACVALARWLASRERDLDEAVAMARRALEKRADPELSRELASWLESLGDAASAAEALRPLARDPASAATVLVRVGVLSARAAEGEAARDAFTEAARADPTDALSCELRASLSGWAPEVVSAEEAAEAYVDAAQRREQAGAIEAQMEDLWRAIEADPRSERATEALVAALSARGRTAAAAEAWRAFAVALGTDPRAVRAHARARMEATTTGDVAHALAAALDEGLDAEVEGPGADALDGLLVRAGLTEAIAARLEARAERASTQDRARLFEELGRLHAGPLASPERAAEWFARAFGADPTRTEALVALRAHAAQRRDVGPLVEALVRALSGEGGDGERAKSSRVTCGRTLAQLAEEQLGDLALASWAMERLLAIEPKDSNARTAIERWAPRVSKLRAGLDEAKRAEGGDRAQRLRVIAAATRGFPAEIDTRSRTLAELASLTPDDRAAVADAYRLAWRRGDADAVQAIAEKQIESASDVLQKVEARRQLGAAFRARGAAADANRATKSLLDEAPSNRAAACVAWVDAAIARDEKTRARAIERVASGAHPAARAALLGVAATTYLGMGDAIAARRAAEQGLVADAQNARCIAVLADATIGAPDRAAAAAIERAIGAVGARAAWCMALADTLERTGELNYAVSWTQRYVALRPGDAAAIEALIGRVVRARDGSRLGDALAWVLSQPQPAGSLAELVAHALRELGTLDADRAVVIARRALDVFGPRHDALREAMAEAARKGNDDAFGAALLERWMAIGAHATERSELHAELVRLRARLGDHDGEARAIVRAVREGYDVRAFETNLATLADMRLSADGELARLEATAALRSLGGDALIAAEALREHGAAAWDLAGDRLAAKRSWVKAATLAPTHGYATLGADLARFGDPRLALDALLDLYSREREPARMGAIAAEAGRAALALGDAARAFDLAITALEKNPQLAVALEIAERGAAGSNRASAMSPLYDSVASRSLGRFGRRAAHYRAARFFEQRSEAALAVRHAAEAFAAVPSEGATFILLARTAERASDAAAAIRTIERVADAAKDPAARAAWLLRAASVTPLDADGLRQRCDVLLRAVLAQPTIPTIAMLADTMRALLEVVPDEREGLSVRISHAGAKLCASLEGPEGARVAIAIAALELELFEDAESAFGSIERALAMDGDLDEYAQLAPMAPSLGDWENAKPALAATLTIAERPYANVGAAAMKLLAAIAEGAGDRGAYARAIVLAADRDPDDDAVVRAADAAVRESDDRKLDERLSKRVPSARRVEALRAHAREQSAVGEYDLAIDALERAADLAAADARVDVERELRAACDLAGRGERNEDRALRAASDATLGVKERAARWADLASERERRLDLAGAASALFEAAVMDPESIERWSALERVADLSGRQDLRVHALQEIAARGPGGSRTEAMRRLARAQEERGDLVAAESVWNELLASRPDDEDADQAIESIVTRRGDYNALVDHLGLRAERLSLASGTREALRAVRLRRAAILEQRLNRPEDACEELALLLTESPDHEGALGYLADLHERLGRHDRAAPLWRRVAGIAKDPWRQSELELRAAESARTVGDLATALAHTRSIVRRHPGHRAAVQLRADIAREAHDDAELAAALDDLASIVDDIEVRSDMLVEAAQASARASDFTGAITRAQRAAKIAPMRASAQLYARGLEYRARGSGTPDEARLTIEELSKIVGALVPDDAALQAFLIAEALDVVQGKGAGMQRLHARRAEIGPHPVLALGIGERFVATWKFADAVPHFGEALAGNLFGLRRRGVVALAAADAASRVEDHDRAVRFLDIAAAETDTRAAALRRLAQMVTARGDVARSRAVLLELARTASGEDRARTLAQLARVLLASGSPEDRGEAERVLGEAVDAAPAQSVARAQLQTELDGLRNRPVSEAIARARASAPPPPPEHEASPASPSPQIDFDALEKDVDSAKSDADRATAQVALARAHVAKGAVGAGETMLREALAAGSAEAGDDLAGLLERDGSRATELVRVRARLVALAPGNRARLEALRAAAAADRDATYARSLEHVLRAFDPGAGPLPPPSLYGQSAEPGILALLTRSSKLPLAEAIALVWDGGGSIFAKTPIAYAITGVERILPGPASPLSRLFEAAVRLLDAPRIPLFHRRGTSMPVGNVALVQPASALISGDAHEESAALRYELGRAIAMSLPEHVLTLGLVESEVRAVWAAMLGAFGPHHDRSPALDRGSAQLAEKFWQSIPPRSQRRLQEVLVRATSNDFDALLVGARQSARRVGLFLAGDFGHAARAYLKEREIDAALAQGDGLAELCAAHPALADLFALAVSPEYADARWHPVAPASQRALSSSAGARRPT